MRGSEQLIHKRNHLQQCTTWLNWVHHRTLGELGVLFRLGRPFAQMFGFACVGRDARERAYEI